MDPLKCPEGIYSIALECWRYLPEKRPGFDIILDTLGHSSSFVGQLRGSGKHAKDMEYSMQSSLAASKSGSKSSHTYEMLKSSEKQ